MKKLRKKGRDVQPVEIEGRKIARTFWGRAWCDHLTKFSDYSNRLPRGRAYVCNGLVCHLEIAEGAVTALVSGSKLYNVSITIKKLPGKKWSMVKERCAGQIGSLLELLQGKFSKSVMTVVTDRDNGLFPLPREISLSCDCPDWAVMCKHVAAALYGVGSRLDERPELLFLLRGVKQEELISVQADSVTTGKKGGRKRIADSDLTDVFGLEMVENKSTRRRGKKRK
ncbi:MAG: SWIM zinc finger family protein [Candidatus Margulisiibacteriota bacterium]